MGPPGARLLRKRPACFRSSRLLNVIFKTDYFLGRRMRLDDNVGFLVATFTFILHEDFKDLSWGFVLSHLLNEVEELQNLRGYLYRMLKLVKGSIDFFESLNCFDVCCKVLLRDQIILCVVLIDGISARLLR